MGANLRIQGVVPPDERWNKMRAIYDACKAAGVKSPEAVTEFFGDDEEPDPKGALVQLDGRFHGITEWKSEYADGYEIELASLPKHIKSLRFYISY